MFDRYCIKWKTECWKIISHSVTLSLLRAGQSQTLSTFASLLTSWCCRITRPSGESLGAIWSSMRPRTSRTSSPSAGRVCWTSTGQWRLFVYMGPHQRVKPEAQWMRHGLWIFYTKFQSSFLFKKNQKKKILFLHFNEKKKIRFIDIFWGYLDSWTANMNICMYNFWFLLKKIILLSL